MLVSRHSSPYTTQVTRKRGPDGGVPAPPHQDVTKWHDSWLGAITGQKIGDRPWGLVVLLTPREELRGLKEAMKLIEKGGREGGGE